MATQERKSLELLHNSNCGLTIKKIQETTIRHGLKFEEIEIPDSISIEHASLGGNYEIGSALFNGRYYWRRENEKTGINSIPRQFETSTG